MPKNTITFVLHGEIPLLEFSAAIERWSKLIETLSREIGERDDIEWEIEKLQSSNPTTTIRGKSPDMEAVERVVMAQEIVWESMQNDLPIPYSASISRQAASITSLINGKIKAIEITTEKGSSKVEQAFEKEILPEEDFSYGTITGYVETISIHKTNRFVIYDLIFGKAVFCKFTEKQKKLVKDSWDKKVTVSGKVFRNKATGIARTVADITMIKIHEKKGSYQFEAASGVIPWQSGDEMPELVIRRIRDEQ